MLAKNKLKKEVYQDIQSEIGGELHEIESIVDSQFSFLAKHMSLGYFDSVRLPYFGRFAVNPYRLRKINISKATKGNTKL